MKKGVGRRKGTPNVKTGILRSDLCTQFRCTEGFNKTVEELISSGLYKSKADVMHEALHILACRKLPGTFPYLNQIN